jgi:hypothetical protein
MKLTRNEPDGSACVLCGAMTAAEPMGFTPEAARLFEQQFGHSPDVHPQRICERCQSLNPEERKALARRAFISTNVNFLCDMGLTREQALEVVASTPEHLLPKGFLD